MDDDLPKDTVEALGEIAGALMKSARKVSNGAIQGALTGFATGGPTGSLVGAGIGALGGPVTGSTSTPRSGQVSGVSGAGQNPYASQLLATLLRPEMIQALLALALYPRGSSTQNVAGMPVPLTAFTDLLQSLANRAAAEYQSHQVARKAGETWAEYLSDSAIVENDVHSQGDALLNLMLVQSEDEASMESFEEVTDSDDDVFEILDVLDIHRLGDS